MPWMQTPRFLAAALAGAVAVPFLTLALPFRLALAVQAALLLGIFLALAVWALLNAGGRRHLWLTPAPGLAAAGVAFWTAAAGLGAAVGLASGNAPARVAGQLLSMGLLPVGFVAARTMVLGLPADERKTLRQTFARALVAAVSAAAALQLLLWLFSAGLRGGASVRAHLANSVSVSSLVPLALIFSLALPEAVRSRSLRWACWGVLGIVLVASAVRGAWIAAVAGLVIWVLLDVAVLKSRRGLRGLALLAGAGAVAALFLLAAGRYLDAPRPNVLPWPERVSQQFRTSLSLEGEGRLSWSSDLRRAWVGTFFPVEPETLYRLRAEAGGSSAGPAFVVLSWRDDEGERTGGLQLRLPPTEEALPSAVYGRPPPGTTQAVLLVGNVKPEPGGQWRVAELRVEPLGPAWSAPLVQQAAYLRHRILSLAGAAGDPLKHRRTLSFRAAESRRLLELWRESSWTRRLLGHGLGAEFTLDGERLHYVHNFYLFALYKLGLLGSLLALGGGALWTASALLASRCRSAASAFAAAAAAAWLAYWLWSVSSPEILNFRLAPLWGLLTGLQPWALPQRGALPKGQ